MAKQPKDTALKPTTKDSKDIQKAVTRGARSAEKAKLPASKSKTAAKARHTGSVTPKALTRPKAVSKPLVKKPAVKRSPPKTSALQKPSKSYMASAASTRGHKSGGKLKRRR